MAKATRKEWTKTMAVLRLKDIEKALADVGELAERGGKMPCALRTKLKNRLKGISELIKDFQEWQPCLSAETVRSLKSPRKAPPAHVATRKK